MINITLGELIKEIGADRVDDLIYIGSNSYSAPISHNIVHDLDVGNALRDTLLQMSRNIDMLNEQVLNGKLELSKLKYIIDNHDCQISQLPQYDRDNQYVTVYQHEIEVQYKKHKLKQYISNI